MKVILNKKILILFLIVLATNASGQVKVRLFSNQKPESAVFSVTEGKYEINTYNGKNIIIGKGEPVLLSRYDGRLAVKMMNSAGFIADSVLFSGLTDDDNFSLRINGNLPVKQFYSGHLIVRPDLETLIMINCCDEEKYIAGVVRAEGGTGKNSEYFKSQAILVRTYLYKYINKHKADGYNLCDNTHCQVFRGLCGDTSLNTATLDTRGLVILDSDSILVISAFHSNCGGETSLSEFIWLSEQPYLKKVTDPYCAGSKNAIWQKKIAGDDWIRLMVNSGYSQKLKDLSEFRFMQISRVADYRIPSFSIPLNTIRNEFNLRSTFFSVIPVGDSILLKGRGYGHGVGLCQEGAMEMAARGFNYRQIIGFYYPGVIISDIKYAKKD